LTSLYKLELVLEVDANCPVDIDLDKNRFFYMINKLLYNSC